MEHVTVDIGDRLHTTDSELSERESVLLLPFGFDFGEMDRVGVARIQDDLDSVDGLAPANAELEPVPEVNEGVSTEKSQGGSPQLAGNCLSDDRIFHAKTPSALPPEERPPAGASLRRC